MRFRNAALGLAAVGAGLLVAGLLRRWGGEGEHGAEPVPHPPEPADLIGYPMVNPGGAAGPEQKAGH